jgi:hypothetical protein
MSGPRQAADRTVASLSAGLRSHPLRRSSSTSALHGFIPGRTLRDPTKNLCAIQSQVSSSMRALISAWNTCNISWSPQPEGAVLHQRGIQVCPFIGEETRCIVLLVWLPPLDQARLQFFGTGVSLHRIGRRLGV